VCVTLFDKEQLAHAAQVAERLGLAIEVHVKVDTGAYIASCARAGAREGRARCAAVRAVSHATAGMGRIGVQPEETGAFFAELLRYRPHVRATGVFTHLARADEDTDFNAEQLDRFAAALRGIEALGAGLPHWIHIANSAATIRLPERIKTLSTMVRMGLNTYGLRYAPSVPLPTDVEPALRWVSQLCHIKVGVLSAALARLL
jgi:alanine racemase